MEVTHFASFSEKIVKECEKIIKGKTDVIEKLIVCFLCGGHILLEDVPGTGKTMLLRAFSTAIGGNFKRIQFTPDLLPSDLTGINFYNMKNSEFEFRPGPVFANAILADEINRATPRTQSALLEAMAEGQVTVDGNTYKMEEPFIIMATQNPLETGGTFPLPEAQLDRFFMRLSLGYMDRADEISVLRGEESTKKLSSLNRVTDSEEIKKLKENISEIEVTDDVVSYIMDIITATRNDSRIRLGAGTRGAIALYKASQAYAAIKGSSFVTPDHVKHLAPFVLSHRLTVAGSMKKTEAEALVSDICNKLVVPLN